ncbi:hypothetical protein [Sphingosinicella sp. BN140058]|uniref:hypothetical protein n=1 Tax=Sphingosinicella sp. BN140058 TaxID=1892855 RepID=UPI0010110EC2|nr:hypothetical protein [Sphingosinicella sp. BN140058]QAY76995.1 hypothetical protein ETR14_11155 [Sphingosinicella sp. BN140058]
MKVLFYLPVVTSWWFDNIVEPLIRRLSDTAEVTVLAPKPWRGTGLGERELARCVDLPNVRWCIMDGPDHPSTRTRPRAATEMIAFVQDLAPDFVFCRSADCETVKAFPGTIRFLMEGGVSPFKLPDHWIMLQEQPLDQGLLPPLEQSARDCLMRAIEPAWSKLRQRHCHAPAGREVILAAAGLPSDRPILLLPLEYDHEENFFAMHRACPRPNHRLVKDMADRLRGRFTLALTNHPLNQLYVDNSALEAAVAKAGGTTVLLPPTIDGMSSTLALAPHVDGLIVHDSKAFALAPLCGTPLLRRSHFAGGDWLSAYADLESFLKAIESGSANVAEESSARLWTAFHLANNAFDPKDPTLTAAEILDRAASSLQPRRWDASLNRVRAVLPELFK